MSAAIEGSGFSTRETFARFFEWWVQEQNQHLQSLVSATREYEEKTRNNRLDQEEQKLRSEVERMLEHYKHYYQVKEERVKEDALTMMSPSWRSSLEDAFLWIGGWRPTMAFHLLYSKSGLQVESCLHELMQGLGVADLGGISGTQMERIDELHRETIKKERQIDEKLAKHQESVADTSMVKLSGLVSERMRSTGGDHRVVAGEDDEDDDEVGQIETVLKCKEDGIEKIIKKADNLRLETLEAVVEILSPIQAAQYLIAAAELHLRVHDWGKKRDHDRDRHQHPLITD